MNFKEKVKDLIDATFAEDEPAMAKILEEMTREELDDLNVHFSVLKSLIRITMQNKGTPNGWKYKW